MQILERIEGQMSATGLPLVGITLAAVPCPDTPVILTLHWHGFIRQKLVELEEAETVAYTPIPSSSLQLNDRWRDLRAVDHAAMEAAWALGAWDVERAERRPVSVRGLRITKNWSVCRLSAPTRATSMAPRWRYVMRPILMICLNWQPSVAIYCGPSGRCAAESGRIMPMTPPCPRRAAGPCRAPMHRFLPAVPASAKWFTGLASQLIVCCRL